MITKRGQTNFLNEDYESLKKSNKKRVIGIFSKLFLGLLLFVFLVLAFSTNWFSTEESLDLIYLFLKIFGVFFIVLIFLSFFSYHFYNKHPEVVRKAEKNKKNWGIINIVIGVIILFQSIIAYFFKELNDSVGTRAVLFRASIGVLFIIVGIFQKRKSKKSRNYINSPNNNNQRF